MNFANSQNLVHCSCCNAIYDKTAEWVRGYYQGTSCNFIPAITVKENSCPICGNDNHE